MTTRDPADPGLGREPAEGRSDLALPGADTAGRPMGLPADQPAGGPMGNGPTDRGPADGGPTHEPDSPEAERRDELARRVGVGSPSPAGRDRPDVLPDVEPPEVEV